MISFSGFNVAKVLTLVLAIQSCFVSFGGVFAQTGFPVHESLPVESESESEPLPRERNSSDKSQARSNRAIPRKDVSCLYKWFVIFILFCRTSPIARVSETFFSLDYFLPSSPTTFQNRPLLV
jgi:hypothetical protein